MARLPKRSASQPNQTSEIQTPFFELSVNLIHKRNTMFSRLRDDHSPGTTLYFLGSFLNPVVKNDINLIPYGHFMRVDISN